MDILGHQTDSIIFGKGFAVRTAKYRYHKNEGLNYYSFTDSLQDTFSSFPYNEKKNW